MTDAELRDAAVRELEKTTVSGSAWVKGGRKPGRWKTAMGLLAQIDAGPDPPDPPAGVFGADLAAFLPPLPASPGPVVNVSSVAELVAALKVGNVVDGGGRTFQNVPDWKFKHAQTVTTTLRNMTLAGGLQTVCSYVRFENVTFQGGRPNALKLVSWGPWGGVCNDVELVGCKLLDAPATGLLVGGDGMQAVRVAVRRSILRNNGSTANGNLDHNVYLAACDRWLIEACLLERAAAYNVQAYPKATNGLVAGCVADGTKAGAGGRGSVLFGTEETTGSTRDCKAVGTVASGTSNGYPGFDKWRNPTGITVTDCQGTSAFPAVRTSTVPPVYTRDVQGYITGASGRHVVDASQYGWLPAVNLDGSPRSRPVTGCFA